MMGGVIQEPLSHGWLPEKEKEKSVTQLTLYPHQARDVAALRGELASGKKRVLLQAVTGYGKTITAAWIALSAKEKGNMVLFVVAGRNLVNQTAASFNRVGLKAGVVMAGVPVDRDADVQVASVDTLNSRLGKGMYSWLVARASLLIIDEAHESMSQRFHEVREFFNGIPEIGLTATPERADGQGLGRVYESMIGGSPYHELIEQGYLVAPRFISVKESESQYLKMRGGEFDNRSVEKAYDRIVLVGGVVKHWHSFAEGRPTVVFASSVAHSIKIRDQFIEAGIPAAHVDADTSDQERQQHYDDLANGEIKVICNYGVLGRGWDVTAVSCAIIVREFGHISAWIQAVGRALRSHPGKKDAIVLDLGENYWRHGDFVAFPVQWSLEDNRKVLEKRAEMREEQRKSETVCPACHYVFAAKQCPNCGYEIPPKTREEYEAEEREAVLEEMKLKPTERAGRDSQPTKAMMLSMLRHYGAQKNYKPGWAAVNYKEYYGSYPDAGVSRQADAIGATPPNAICLEWIGKQRRAYHAKRYYTGKWRKRGG